MASSQGEQSKQRASADVIAALGKFSSCEISDALIKLKYPHGGLLPDVGMLSPSRDDTTVNVVGEAFTVKMVDQRDTSAPKPDQHFVDAAEPDSVMIVSAPHHIKSAVWGGLMTARAQFKGVRGVIIDGRCRDLTEHRESGFPVFARGHSTLGQSPFTRPSALQVPLTIEPILDEPVEGDLAFPALTIDPYDIVKADVDGVVFVKPADAAKVIELCSKGREVDGRCMEDLKKGKGVAETFKLHRGK